MAIDPPMLRLVVISAVLVIGAQAAFYWAGHEAPLEDQWEQAAALEADGRMHEAERILHHATEAYPDQPLAWLRYGTFLSHQEGMDEAAEKALAAACALPDAGAHHAPGAPGADAAVVAEACRRHGVVLWKACRIRDA
ncbi:MAG: tetratricopeptide repeat protein, partial [Planctomycetes bacterium]|nr:tetratricopeptide repeat protein [Planctomycetota bacterium]